MRRGNTYAKQSKKETKMRAHTQKRQKVTDDTDKRKSTQRGRKGNLVRGGKRGPVRIHEVVTRTKVQGRARGVSFRVGRGDALVEKRHRGLLGKALDQDARRTRHHTAAVDLDRVFERAKGRLHAVSACRRKTTADRALVCLFFFAQLLEWRS